MTCYVFPGAAANAAERGREAGATAHGLAYAVLQAVSFGWLHGSKADNSFDDAPIMAAKALATQEKERAAKERAAKKQTAKAAEGMIPSRLFRVPLLWVCAAW